MTAPSLAIDLTAATVKVSEVFDITVDGTDLTLHTSQGTVVIDRTVADRAAAAVVTQQGVENAAASWVA